jgi:hypothetical protein
MVIKIQAVQDNLTISKEFVEDDMHPIRCEDLLLAAVDIISRIFSDRTVVEAWGKIDPDGLCIRE